jgi:hypothetical protein
MFRRMLRAIASFDLMALEPRRLFAAGVHVSAGDVNGDGLADMVVAQPNADGGVTITPFLSRKQGRAIRTASVDMTRKEFEAMCIGDLTGDGHPDIVVASSKTRGTSGGKGAMVIFVGDGKGNVERAADGTPVKKSIDLPDGVKEVRGIVVGDLDGDGAQDLAALWELKGPRDASSGQSAGRMAQVAVLWGAGPGGAASIEVKGNSVDEYCDGNAIGDVDRDGLPDLVAYKAEEQLKGNPRHVAPPIVTFTGFKSRNPTVSEQPNVIQLPHHGSSTSSNMRVYTLGLGDLDGDGVSELIGLENARGGGGGGSVLVSASFDPATGRWKAPELNSHSDTHLVIEPGTSATGDFNGDGRADFRIYSPKSDVWAFGDSEIGADGKMKLVWSPRSNVQLYG